MVHFNPGSPLEPERNHPDSSAVLKGGEAARGGFLDELKTRIQEVNSLQNNTDGLMRESAVKGATNVHETMIQMEKADLSLRMMLRVRDKAISAYQEIMRMQF